MGSIPSKTCKKDLNSNNASHKNPEVNEIDKPIFRKSFSHNDLMEKNTKLNNNDSSMDVKIRQKSENIFPNIEEDIIDSIIIGKRQSK